MNTGPSRTASTRPAVLGGLLVLAAFVAVFVTALFALQRIDEVYQSTERTVNRTMRAVLRGDRLDGQVVEEMRSLFEALERLERIAVRVDLRSTSAGLATSLSEYLSGVIEFDEIVDRFSASFDELEKGIEEKRQSITRSFYALIVALALSLIVAILVAAVLSYRLGISRVEADWSQRSLKRSLAAEEQLRRRIANDLHDNAAQDIAAARMLCERSAHGSQNGDAATAAERALEAAGLLASAGRMIRGLALDLRPPELERSDLVAALVSLCSRSRDAEGRPVNFSLDGNAPLLTNETAIQVYRIVQEALANTRKHAGNHRVEVRLCRTDTGGASGILLTIRDYSDASSVAELTNGAPAVSIDTSMSSGMGMAIMRERATLAGGRLSVETERGGTMVSFVLPATKMKETHDEKAVDRR